MYCSSLTIDGNGLEVIEAGSPWHSSHRGKGFRAFGLEFALESCRWVVGCGEANAGAEHNSRCMPCLQVRQPISNPTAITTTETAAPGHDRRIAKNRGECHVSCLYVPNVMELISNSTAITTADRITP